MSDWKICMARLEELSAGAAGRRPREEAKAIIEQYRALGDAGGLASLNEKLQREFDQLRTATVSTSVLAAHNLKLAVLEGALDALK